MKSSICRILFVALLCGLFFAPNSHAITKVNDYLFVEKQADDLYFVMERVDKAVPGQRLEFWKNFIAKDQAVFPKYEKARRSGLNVYLKGGWESAGQIAFESSLLKHSDNNELWVAFATSNKIEKLEDCREENIEMFLSVLTTDDAPMTVHMGNGRSYGYLLSNAEGNAERSPIHPKMALSLHSYAARVSLSRDATKRFVVSAPVPKMLQVFTAALPKSTYVFDPEKAKTRESRSGEVIERNSSFPRRFILRDKDRKSVLFDYDFDDEVCSIGEKTIRGVETERYNWIFHQDMGLSYPVAAVDIQALADLTPQKR